MEQSLIPELQQVFRDHFADPTLTINLETSADDIDEWDSLTHVGLILAVERVFGVRFNSTEIAGLENVGSLEQLIKERLSR